MTKQIEPTKYCSICKEEKPVSCFTKLKPRKKRKQDPNLPTQYYNQRKPTYDTYCSSCRSRKQSERRPKGPISKVPKEYHDLMKHIRYLMRAAKVRAKKQGLPCDLDDMFMLDLMLQQERKCPFTRLEFTMDRSKDERAASIDQIEPAKGYTKDNVEWVSWAANRAKGQMSRHDFLMMCKRISEINHDYYN